MHGTEALVFVKGVYSKSKGHIKHMCVLKKLMIAPASWTFIEEGRLEMILVTC